MGMDMVDMLQTYVPVDTVDIYDIHKTYNYVVEI